MLNLGSNELKLSSWIRILMMDSWIGYSLALIVDPIWIQMLKMDTNVRIGFKWAKVIFMDKNVDDGFMSWIQVWFDYWTNLDTNVKDRYKC